MFDFEQAKRIFPNNFRLDTENDKTFLIIVTTENTSGSEVFIEVQRECDRISFLTGEQLNPQFQYAKNAGGIKTYQQYIDSSAWFVKPLPQNIDKQEWDGDLETQLRLWQIAESPDLSIATRINLLFQIIEIAFSGKDIKTNCLDKYSDSNKSPCPIKECRLLRNLVSHGGEAGDCELRTYCNFLGISTTLHDLTNPIFMQAIKNRLDVIKVEARKVINGKITSKNE